MTSFSIFITLKKKKQENLSKVLNTFENIMENEAFAPKEQIFLFSIFSNTLYFKGIKRRYYNGVKG